MKNQDDQVARDVNRQVFPVDRVSGYSDEDDQNQVDSAVEAVELPGKTVYSFVRVYRAKYVQEAWELLDVLSVELSV